MKRKLLTAGFMVLSLILCINSASAQQRRERPNMEEMQKKQLEEMKTELSLTDEQVEKISAIMEEQRTAMEANREENSKDREAQMEERKAYNEKIKAVLTEEQQTKFDELQEKRREERGNRRPN